MKEIQKGTLRRAAVKAAVSEKTARKYIRLKKLPSSLKLNRSYRTRSNPFSLHWEEIVRMLERSPELQAQTIMTYLLEKYPNYKPGQIRTLQRYVKQWKAEHGLEKPVIFRQNVKPGVQSQSDWTHMTSLGITINGKPFDHLLFHFVLPYSGFETAMICQSESLDSLTRGFEQASLELGGIAIEHRTDNLTAATQKFGNSRIFTKRWLEFLSHYGVQPSRNNPGVSHENGSIEKSHHTFKNAVDQHLMLRQSRNFKTIEDYRDFLEKIKNKRNFIRREKIIEEQATLRELPEKQFNEVSMLKVRVSPSSTVNIFGVTYSVPSRLISLWLKAAVFRDYIELMYGNKTLVSLPRLEMGALIDYRHIIDSLIRKPGAFEQYQYKSFLYPNVIFRKAYDFLKQKGLNSKKYLELLHLAKIYGENKITAVIDLLLEAEKFPLKENILELLDKKRAPKHVNVLKPNLSDYDKLHCFE
jgi:transposase